MKKTKTHKGTIKRIKKTAGNKLIRRHQLAKGHLRSKKSKKKTQAFRRTQEVVGADKKKIKRLLKIA